MGHNSLAGQTLYPISTRGKGLAGETRVITFESIKTKYVLPQKFSGLYNYPIKLENFNYTIVVPLVSESVSLARVTM